MNAAKNGTSDETKGRASNHRIDGGDSCRHLGTVAMTFGLLTLLILPTVGEAESDRPRPNIVVFLADDMGWGDSSTYGHETIQTPHLDELASQGVKFTQCYSACGVCSPSRSAILTGHTPIATGSIDTSRAITKPTFEPARSPIRSCCNRSATTPATSENGT